MKTIIGNSRASVASLALLACVQTAAADALRWIDGMPGGADVVLSVRSVDEAEGALRSLARSAQVDWLPTSGRLLAATNLAPGADTDRPMAFGFSTHDEGEDAVLDFVAVIPSARPAVIAANFGAVPSPQHAGLFAFDFAGREYFARVLPDDHLAISGSPDTLLELRESEASQMPAPIRLSLHGEGSLRTLTALGAAVGLGESGDQSPDATSMMPEGVDAITLDLLPAAEAMTVDLRISAAPGSDRASRWTPADGANAGAMPFPSGDYLLVGQGSMDDAVVREWLPAIAERMLGLGEGVLEGARSAAVLVGAPQSMFDWSGLAASVALESDDPDALRRSIGAALARLPGASVSMKASTRVGVEIDRFRLQPREAPGNNGPAGSGWAGLMSGGAGDRQGQAVEGRMFARGERVYLTTIPDANGIDRLIAFGPGSTAIQTHENLGEWLARLPGDSAGRMAINIRPIAGLIAMGASAQGGRVTLPEVIPPVVASVRTAEGGVSARVIFPSEVVLVLEQVRRTGTQMRDRR